MNDIASEDEARQDGLKNILPGLCWQICYFKMILQAWLTGLVGK